MTIELHIDDLILRGFGPLDRARLRAALARELARLIEERGLPGLHPRPLPLRGGELEGRGVAASAARVLTEQGPPAPPEHIAAHAAAALYDSLAAHPELRAIAGAAIPRVPPAQAPLPLRGGAEGEVGPA